MSSTTTGGLGQRLAARWAAMRARPGTLLWQPEPPAAGDARAGRRLATGLLIFDARAVESTAAVPWDLPPPDAAWAAHLHGHGWLDDLTASGEWEVAGRWVWAWIARFGDGSGPGWRADLVARRLTRWLAHSPRLLQGREAEDSHAFFRAVSAQTRFLAGGWRRTVPGLARIEALSGLVYALLSLEERAEDVPAAIAELGSEAAATILPAGGIASRNPDELIRVTGLLAWAAGMIEGAGHAPADAHRAAIARAIALIPLLLHADGTPARFHGGGRAAASPPREAPPGAEAMGFVRIAAGRTVLILDGAEVPAGPARATAHASPLALEVSTAAGPLIVSQGSGLGFASPAPETARRGPAHSGPAIGEGCVAELLDDAGPDHDRSLTAPGAVSARLIREPDGFHLAATSGLWHGATGLTLERHLHVAPDGARIDGEDTAIAGDRPARQTFQTAFTGRDAVLTLRFHLHPEVRATLALGGKAVLATLPGGAAWQFRADGTITLAPSVYCQPGRVKPRATQQIVVTCPVIEYWGRIRWSLAHLPAA